MVVRPEDTNELWFTRSGVLQDAGVCCALAYESVEGGLGGAGAVGSSFSPSSVSRFLLLCWVQGKGAFGSVVKARNKIDSRIYAGLFYPSSHPASPSLTSFLPVKKIRLRTMQSDSKISRKVNALSRLSHHFIVCYYTIWVKTAESTFNAASDDSTTESTDEDGRRETDSMAGSLSTLRTLVVSPSRSRRFLVLIHFDRSTSPGGEILVAGRRG